MTLAATLGGHPTAVESPDLGTDAELLHLLIQRHPRYPATEAPPARPHAPPARAAALRAPERVVRQRRSDRQPPPPPGRRPGHARRRHLEEIPNGGCTKPKPRMAWRRLASSLPGRFRDDPRRLARTLSECSIPRCSTRFRRENLPFLGLRVNPCPRRAPLLVEEADRGGLNPGGQVHVLGRRLRGLVAGEGLDRDHRRAHRGER